MAFAEKEKLGRARLLPSRDCRQVGRWAGRANWGSHRVRPPMNWRAMATKPPEGGLFPSAFADFVKLAQHCNGGRGGCAVGRSDGSEKPSRPAVYVDRCARDVTGMLRCQKANKGCHLFRTTQSPYRDACLLRHFVSKLVQTQVRRFPLPSPLQLVADDGAQVDAVDGDAVRC